jgi:hypothetical protein
MPTMGLYGHGPRRLDMQVLQDISQKHKIKGGSKMKSVKWFIVVAVFSIFTVSFASAFTGSSAIKWTAPTTFVDGTALNPATDLQGFRIYCGSASKQYSTTPAATIVGGTVATYTMNNLAVGTTYCAITAVTTAALGGLESALSNEASKTITAPASGGCTGFTMN